jgi:hypothetical protein
MVTIVTITFYEDHRVTGRINMTNEEKDLLRQAVTLYKLGLPNGEIFNLTELWNFVRDYTGRSFTDCSLRNYLKAFGGVHIGGGQWEIKGLV